MAHLPSYLATVSANSTEELAVRGAPVAQVGREEEVVRIPRVFHNLADWVVPVALEEMVPSVDMPRVLISGIQTWPIH
jgi:hypothetical protein